MKYDDFIEIYALIENKLINIYSSIPLIKKYKLKKMSSNYTLIDISKIKEVTKNNNLTNKIIYTNEQDKQFKEIINYFLEVMNRNFDEIDLQNLYRNIVSVEFKRDYNIKFLGAYSPIKNCISYLSKKDRETITHELLHLSSNSFDKNLDGFNYRVDNKYIGYGLNEGYTELLNQRYFNSNNNGYYYQITTCKYLEKIVGKSKMEKFYLNANLFGLIKELEKNYSSSQISNFISSVDFTHDYDKLSKLSDYEYKEFCYNVSEIILFLFEGYCKVLSSENIDKNISKEVLQYYLYSIISDFDIFATSEFVEKVNSIISENVDKKIKINIKQKKI